MNTINANCIVCDGSIILPTSTEVTEVVCCPECATRLVVNSINESGAMLSKAPEVEEDWGE